MPATIFELCAPRADVLQGTIRESDFAADLAQVIRGSAPQEYANAARFFETTYPTRGLRNLLANVCRRLSGVGGESAAIFRLDTQFGGGKTHALIALVHAAGGLTGVSGVSEFVDPAFLPRDPVRVAMFDGENADPSNGRTLGSGLRAYTPWGELAYALAGPEGYARVRASDEQRVAPGADTLRELVGDAPALILLDELGVYLRKVKRFDGAGDQLAAFLTSLIKAVESTPRAALVYTLAVGKDAASSDAYSDENQRIAARMAEAESISARKATLLDPTERDETAHVLRRRLFATIDAARVPEVVDAYRALWKRYERTLSADAARPETAAALAASYPLHPDVLDTLTTKLATLSNFHRVRGMLRILARTVAQLWQERPADVHAIHVHHIDPANERIQQEFVTRLGLKQYVPALRSDVAGDGVTMSLAQALDADHYAGLPPYASYVARTIFVHTLAFDEKLRGVTPEHLRYSVVGPGTDASFVDDARQRFAAESAFLDDRPGAPLRFNAEANLTQLIRQQEGHVDREDARAQLKDRIRQIFARTGEAKFDPVFFPGGAYDVPDEIGDGRPLLVILGYDAVSVGSTIDAVPTLVRRIFEHKGADDKAVRLNRNALVFIAADEPRADDMRRHIVKRLALQELKRPERLNGLSEHQQAKVREMESKAEQEVAVAIQQCYRHLFYPTRAGQQTDGVDLAHTAIDVVQASAAPGSGQRAIERVLRELKKLRVTGDEPDSPAYIRDRTPLKKGEITTRVLREEFRRDPGLPMLVGDDVFVAGVRRGVEQGEYVYRRGDLLYGPGDPLTSIEIDEQATVFTMATARDRDIWPRAAAPASMSTLPFGSASVSAPTVTVPSTPAAAGPPPPAPNRFSADGVLRQALAELWDKVRARKVERIGRLTIRMADAGDAFRLLGVIGAVRGAQKHVSLDGGYETTDGGSLEFTFKGPSADAQVLKEFLEPQLRAANERSLNAEFELRFDGGLAVATDAPEKLTDLLARTAASAAYVTATVESQDGGGKAGPL